MALKVILEAAIKLVRLAIEGLRTTRPRHQRLALAYEGRMLQAHAMIVDGSFVSKPDRFSRLLEAAKGELHKSRDAEEARLVVAFIKERNCVNAETMRTINGGVRITNVLDDLRPIGVT